MQVTLSPAVEADFEFAYEVKRQALGPHVKVRWGWDDAFQRELHRRRWTERPWSIIMSSGEKVGTVSLTRASDHVRFEEFYLLSRFQNQGIGSEVLRTILQQADAEGWTVRLQYLRWNPVGSLYKRHGFALVAENDSHYFLDRAPQQPSL